MTQFYPNGIGGTIGDQLATCKPLLLSGNAWYVSSAIGVNAASPAGRNREEPLATLQQAVTNAVAGDIIVLMTGHTEVITAAVTIGKAGLIIVGEGSTGGLPTANLTRNFVGNMLDVTAAGVQFRNVWVKPGLVGDGGSPTVLVTGADFLARGCYFQSGALDSSNAQVLLDTGSSGARFENCTFLAAGTSLVAQPLAALSLSVALSDIDILNCTFDSGPFGWSSAAILASAAITTRLRGEGISLLRGADVNINASTTGYFNVQLATGGSRVSW